ELAQIAQPGRRDEAEGIDARHRLLRDGELSDDIGVAVAVEGGRGQLARVAREDFDAQAGPVYQNLPDIPQAHAADSDARGCSRRGAERIEGTNLRWMQLRPGFWGGAQPGGQAKQQHGAMGSVKSGVHQVVGSDGVAVNAPNVRRRPEAFLLQALLPGPPPVLGGRKSRPNSCWNRRLLQWAREGGRHFA